MWMDLYNDNLKLYISAVDHATVYRLSSVIKMFQYRYDSLILFNVREFYSFEHRLYTSALENAKTLYLCSYFLLACIKHNFYIL